jgi:cytochrome c7-like protein
MTGRSPVRLPEYRHTADGPSLFRRNPESRGRNPAETRQEPKEISEIPAWRDGCSLDPSIGEYCMNRRFKDVEHLVRLAALFVGGLLVFTVARAELVPEGFGKYGHYRAGALDDIRAKPINYAGQAACVDCHADIAVLRAQARHKAIACESCHGPLAKHAEDPGQLTPKRPDARPLCVRCHAAKTGKPKRYPSVDVQEHAGDENCLTCHKPHDPRISIS